MNRRNPLTLYWLSEEVYAHDDRNIFPDWGCLAIRYMENKRRDHKGKYQKRRGYEINHKREYRQRPEVRVANAKRMRDLAKSAPDFRAKRNLSRRLNEMMASACCAKSGRSILGFIGCSQSELKTHIERQFERWMSWENYGTKWHIDHIIPCASFDHRDEWQVKACWHWTNLRPLCAKENVAKKDKITLPQMALPIGFH